MEIVSNFVLDVLPKEFRFFDDGLEITKVFPVDLNLKKDDRVVWQFQHFDGHARVVSSIVLDNKLVCAFQKIS